MLRTVCRLLSYLFLLVLTTVLFPSVQSEPIVTLGLAVDGQLTARQTESWYEVRLPHFGRTQIGAAVAFAQAGPGMQAGADQARTLAWTEQSSYPVGEQIVVRYQGLPGSASDWIAVSLAGDADHLYGDWFYTNSHTSGSHVFGPMDPGRYEVRVYYNWPSGGFAVKSRYLFDVGEVATDEPGVSNPSTASVLAWTGAVEYHLGDPVGVYYQNLPGDGADWITVVDEDAADETWGNWFYTDGATDGSHVFESLGLGRYEVRVYFDWPAGGYIVQSRYPFKVVDAAGAAADEQVRPPRPDEPFSTVSSPEATEKVPESSLSAVLPLDLSEDPLLTLTEPLLLPGLRPPLNEVIAETATQFATDTQAQLLFIEGFAARGIGGRSELLPYLQHSESQYRIAALKALEALGQDAVASAPALLPLLRDSDRAVRQHAFDALLGMASEDPVVITGLLEFAASGLAEEGSRVVAIARSLHRSPLVPPAEALPPLVALIHLSDWNYGDAIRTLVSRGGERAIALLEPLLTDGTPSQQVGAVRTLGSIGSDAQGLLSELILLSHSADNDIRAVVLEAISQIAPESEAVQESLLAGLSDSDAWLVESAAKGLLALRSLPDDSRAVVTAAIEQHQTNSRVLQPLSQLLARFGPAVLPQIEAWLTPGHPLRLTAIRVLADLGTVANPLLAPLWGEYEQLGREEKTALLRGAGRLGGIEAEAVLLHAATDSSWMLRRDAARSIALLSELSGPLSVALIQLASDTDSDVAREAAQAMAQFVEELLPLLLDQLSGGNTDERARTARVIGQMGLPAAQAADALYRQSLAEEDPALRTLMEESLWSLWLQNDLELPTQRVESSPLVEDLADQDYTLLVLTTIELVRLMMGPMDPNELDALYQQWEPFLAYPSWEMRQYLLQLCELLQEYLLLRSALVECGYQFEGTMIEAWTALAAQEPNALELALLTARYSRDLLLGLQQQLAAKGVEIDALLPPPDPFELAESARRRHQDALLAAAGYPLEEIMARERQDGLYWVLVDREESVREGYAHAAIIFLDDVAKARTAVYSEGFQAGTEIARGRELDGDTLMSSGYVRWTPPPRAVPHQERWISFPMRLTAAYEGGTLWSDSDPGSQSSLAINYFPGIGARYVWGVGGYVQYDFGTHSFAEQVTLPLDTVQYRQDDLNQIRIVIDARTPGVSTTYAYYYELRDLSAAEVYDLLLEDQRDSLHRDGLEVQTMDEYIEAYRSAEARVNAIALHQQQAAYFAADAARLRQQLATADSDSQGFIAWQLMVAEANEQGEQDQATMAETGQFVRSPTIYDDYVRTRMAEQSSQLAADMNLNQRVFTGLSRLIALVPYGQQPSLIEFVDRNLDYSDSDAVRQLVSIVGGQVEGYWAGQAAEADYAAAVAEEREFWAQMGRTTAGAILVGAAGPAAAAYGFSAQTAAWAPTATRLAYGGTTGYLDNGLPEALKQTVAWSHQVGSLAVAAYDGYHTVGQDGQYGGWTGAAWNAAQSYVYGKVFEFSIQQSARFLTTLAPGMARPVFGGARPTLPPQLSEQQYNQRITQGRTLVSQWQNAQFQLEAARSSGMGGAHVDALQHQVESFVGQINASYEAKWLLKHQTPPNVQRIFTTELERVYDQVMPGFFQTLQTMGYDTDQLDFVPVRNASSSGSVGMDYDLALNESHPVTLRKNGQTIDRHTFMQDAQQAMNSAYFDLTGQSAFASDIHITTLVHSEAFSDMALLQENIDFSQIDPAHVQQAGDVFRTKADLSLQAHQHNEVLQFQAVSRDMEKELRTKVLPFVDSRIQQEAMRGNWENVNKLQQLRQHWDGIYQRMNTIGRHETNPTEIRRLQQELRLLTGTSVTDLVDQMAFHFETLGKFYR